MDIAERNRIVAKALGLTMDQVCTYLTAMVARPDGSWLAYFANEVERAPEVCNKLPAWKVALIPQSEIRGDCDHGNG